MNSTVLIAFGGWVGGNVCAGLVLVGWYWRECRGGTPSRWWPL